MIKPTIGLKRIGSLEEILRAGNKNVINEPLAPRDRIILPPLHTKLGLIKQLVKALDKDGECFTYICQSFPGLSLEMLKAGIFDGPDIQKLMQDENLIHSVNPLEVDAWWGLLELCRISSVIGKLQTLLKLYKAY